MEVGGGVSIVTTNDVVAAYLLERARRRGLNVDMLVQARDDAGVTIADAVDAVADLEATTVVAVVLDRLDDLASIGGSVSRALGRGVLTVVLPTRSSDDSLRLGRSLVRDFLDASGAHPVRTVRELLDVAYALSRTHTLPVNGRVCVLTGSGGVGVLIADRAEQVGLDVAPVPDDAQRRLRQLVPFAGVGNPVDTTAQLASNPDLFADFLRTVLPGGTYDVTLSFMTHVGLIRDLIDRRRAPLADAAAGHPEVVHVMSLLSTEDVQRDLEDDGFLVFEEPLDAAAAVAALVEQGRRMARRAEAPAGTGDADGGRQTHDAVTAIRESGVAVTSVDGIAGDGRVHLRVAFDSHPVVGPTMTLGWTGPSGWLGPSDEVATVAPRTAAEARRSLGSLAAGGIFGGVRGAPALDVDAASQAVAVLAQHARRLHAGCLLVRTLSVLAEGLGIQADIDEPCGSA